MRHFVMNINEINQIQNVLFDKLNNVLSLKQTDFTSKYPMNNVEGSTAWYDEVKGSKLTGVSRYHMHNSVGGTSSINVWMGPGYLIPHLLVAMKYDSNGSIILSRSYLLTYLLTYL